jgi:ElaB/YqjD/DUF883 family membrane-anchored ribosome-binding protein
MLFVSYNREGAAEAVRRTIVAFLLLAISASFFVTTLYSSSIVMVDAFVPSQQSTTRKRSTIDESRVQREKRSTISDSTSTYGSSLLTTLFDVRPSLSSSSQSSWDSLSNKIQSTDVTQFMQQQQQRLSESSSSPLSTASNSVSTSSSITESIQAFVDNLQQQIMTIPSATMQEERSLPSISLDGIASNMNDVMQQIKDGGGTMMTTIPIPVLPQTIINSISMFVQDHPYATVVVSAYISYVVIQFVLRWGQAPPPSKPYPLQKYDPITARQYFDAKPGLVIKRTTTIFVKSLFFIMKLVTDKVRGEEIWSTNQEKRGMEVATLLTELGPTFIKSKFCVVSFVCGGD